MPRTHYETLGLHPRANSDEIRRAFRRLALELHPDRNPRGRDRFEAVLAAYEVLKDPDSKRHYDQMLQLEREREERAHRAPPPPKPDVRTIPKVQAPDIAKLGVLYSRGQFDQAEALARQILKAHPREARAYAVLGDIARSRGLRDQAVNFYGRAVQMDPSNAGYLRRYEELLAVSNPQAAGVEAGGSGVAASLAIGGISVLACVYLALSKEPAIFTSVSLISTWTLGLVGMLFFVGLSVGIALSLAGQLDQFHVSGAVGGVAPTIALGAVAIVNLWLAVGLYAALAFFQRSANPSTTRLFVGAAAGLTLVGLGSSLSPVLNPLQVFLWGGNLVYLGALIGWMVLDSLKRPAP